MRIEVEDECGGLPPGDPEALFHRFEQRGDNRKGLGLGLKLMNVLIMYAQVEGLPVITGTILNENTAMLDMVKWLGFEAHTTSDDPGVTHVRLDLKAIPERL